MLAPGTLEECQISGLRGESAARLLVNQPLGEW
jgi:hypothetical protein